MLSRFGGGLFGAHGVDAVLKTVDETINSDAVLTDDADLQFTVDANSVYSFMVLMYITTDAAPDFQYAFSSPAGASGERSDGFWASGSQMIMQTLPTARSIVVGAPNLIGCPVFGRVVTAGTAGTLAYQWAQNTSDVADTTLHAGTMMMFKKVI